MRRLITVKRGHDQTNKKTKTNIFSYPGNLRPLRRVIRVSHRRHELTNRKTKTNTFIERLQIEILQRHLIREMKRNDLTNKRNKYEDKYIDTDKDI